MNLVQLRDIDGRRRVGIVEGGRLALLDGVERTIDLAHAAIAAGQGLAVAATARRGKDAANYDRALTEGRVLQPVDHPDAAHCLVTGTGLTHLGSAAARDKMHQKLSGQADALTDSLKMFKLGLEGGKPAAGRIGVAPEWFYKGDQSWIVPPGGGLERPGFAEDGGEEPEIVGLYLVGADGAPWRLGFAIGNEFSDHVLERRNYLYLAHSKLRQSSFGPELVVGPLPDHVEGMSRIKRGGAVVWEKPFLSGERNMSHTISNLEHHHFKYDAFRRPGDVHVHYFGTGTLSFSEGFRTEPGDEFEIDVPALGRALRNQLVAGAAAAPVRVRGL